MMQHGDIKESLRYGSRSNSNIDRGPFNPAVHNLPVAGWAVNSVSTGKYFIISATLQA